MSVENSQAALPDETVQSIPGLVSKLKESSYITVADRKILVAILQKLTLESGTASDSSVRAKTASTGSVFEDDEDVFYTVPTENPYTLLKDEADYISTVENDIVSEGQEKVTELLKSSHPVPKKKNHFDVHLIGDSHMRGVGLKLNEQSNNSYHTTCSTYPSATSKYLINFGPKSRGACTVVLAGANDLDSGSSVKTTFNGIKTLVSSYKNDDDDENNSVAVLGIPYKIIRGRWDHGRISFNKKAEEVNSLLSDQFKNYFISPLSTKNTYSLRKCYTYGGTHLNNFGKCIMAKNLHEWISKFFLVNQNQIP